jgi:ABC-2 type transport system permease protein
MNGLRLARLWALVLKELRQIRHSRSLIISMIIPPTIQIVVFGFALNPTVNHLRLGVVDESRTVESRDLISAFVANQTFVVERYYDASGQAAAALDRGDLDAAIVIPADYSRQRSLPAGAHVQLFINAINANTGTIAQGYARLTVQHYNNSLGSRGSGPGRVVPDVALLYNPGLVTAWYIVTGTFSMLLVLNGSLIAANVTIREKDQGTIEQLLMTPATTSEIILAKITPLFMILLFDVFLIIGVTHAVFGVPVRGNLLLIVVAGALCSLVGISIGTFLATLSKTALQAQMMSFFVNPPLAMLSGSTTPVEAMPAWMQPLTNLNPIRHFSLIARGVLIKGVGLGVLYPHFLALLAFAVILMTISMSRFRSQLG